MISMMKIEWMASQPDRSGRYSLRFADGTTMRLYKQTIQDFGLFVGKELEEQEYQRLTEAVSVMSARMRAVRIVSASSVSAKDLEQRLIQKGEDPQYALQAVQWMESLNLLDDRRTAEQIVRKCAAKGYGIARAKQALYEKRVAKEYWDEALADYPDQTDAIIAFLRSRLPEKWERKDLQRVTNALVQRGHSYSDVRKALQSISIEEETWEE